MKKTIIISIVICIITVVGAYALSQVVGTLTGRDTMSIVGIISGFITAYLLALKQGTIWVIPLLESSFLVSIALFILELLTLNIFDDYAHNLWPFSIGFAILFGLLIGLHRGKHITRA